MNPCREVGFILEQADYSPESSSKAVVLHFVNIRFYGQSLGELADWVRIASGQEPQNK